MIFDLRVARRPQVKPPYAAVRPNTRAILRTVTDISRGVSLHSVAGRIMGVPIVYKYLGLPQR